MLKLAGALLILFAATAVGFLQSAYYVKRPKQIRDMIQALQSLETEIIYGFTPLPHALEKIGQSIDPPAAGLFTTTADQLNSRRGRSTKEIWEEGVWSIWPATSLGKNEQSTLLQLGEHLGLSDREDQMKHLRLAMEQLKAEEIRAQSEYTRYGKMWKSLGVLGGLLVVILLI